MATNIVESIIVTLGLDGSQYNSGADKAISKNKALNKSVSETDKVVGNVTKTLGRWFGAIGSATALVKLVDQVQQLNDEVYHLERNLNMSSSTIKNWQGAASAMGGSASGMTESMKGLSKSITDTVLKGDSSLMPTLAALGVGFADANGKARKTNDVMLDLADSFSKMDRQQALSLSQDLGLDEGTFNTLVQGRQEMEKMIAYQDTMYKSSEKELQASRDLAKNRALIGSHWESLKTMLANAVIPAFVKLSEVALTFFEFLQKHQKPIQYAFQGLAFVIGAVLTPILVKATIAALAFIAPFAPFILVVGALGAAFGLLYDDYKVWAEGGKSLFDWGAFRKYIDDSTLSTDNLANSFRKLSKEILESAIPTLNGYAEITQKLSNGDIKGAKSQAWGMIKQLGSNVGNMIDDATGQKQGTLATSAGNLINPVASSNMKAKGGTGTKAQFVEKYLPVAKSVGASLGVPPEALLGQWALETGWGKSITKGTGYNLGNIKAGSSWKGKTVKAYDKAEKSYDPYRVYDTPEAFAKDYVDLISKNKRYKGAIGSKTAKEYFSELKKGGYATDPQYIQSGVSVTNSVLKEMQPTTSPVQQMARQSNMIDLSAVRANEATADKANNVQVTIDKVSINTSSSTMTGTGQDMAQGLQNSFMSLRPSVK